MKNRAIRHSNSGDLDNAMPIKLRLNSFVGKWFLEEQMMLIGIRHQRRTIFGHS